jgi:hypothetical protein
MSAIQVTPDAKAGERLGTISRLPGGAQVTVCGSGFNDQTVRVSCNGSFYFVFLEDVDPDCSARPQARKTRAIDR